MWLQLLMLALLALFLARPATVWKSMFPPASRVVLVLDRSASMSSAGSFDRAIEQAEHALDGLFGFHSFGRETEVMLVAVDREPQILVPFTDDVAQLRDALDTLEVTHVPDRLESLRPFLSSLINDHKATVWLFSDHLPKALEISGLQFSSASTSKADNVGIVTFSIETPQSAVTGRPFAYARIQNTSSAAQRRVVVLEKMKLSDPEQVEGTVFERSLALSGGGGQTINEPLPALRLSHQEPTLFRLRLKPIPGAKGDDFRLDDVAYTVAPPFVENRVSVAVAGDLKVSFLLRALLASRDVEVLDWKALITAPDPSPVDLLICEEGAAIPKKLEVHSKFVVTVEPPQEDTPVGTLQSSSVAEASLVQSVGTEWNRLRVQVTNRKPLEDGESVLLFTGQDTPALSLRGVAQGQPTLVWRFPLGYSSLPLSAALPVVVGRFVDIYGRGSTLPYSGSLTTTDRANRPTGAAWRGALEIRGSGGLVLKVDELDSNLPRIPRLGYYSIKGSQGTAPLAVNLFSPTETALPRTESDRSFTQESAQAAAVKETSTQYKEAGTPLLLILLLLLLLEGAVFIWRGRP